MTPEQIEAKAQELYPLQPRNLNDNILERALFGAMQEAYVSGALSRQPEIDQLQARVKELEEGLNQANTLIKSLRINGA